MPGATRLPTVVIADDHDEMRTMIEEIVRSEWNVVECVADGHSAVQACEKHQPDLLVIDFSMPGLSGIETARLARARWPQLRILVVTSHASVAYVESARQAGASGYLLKRSLVSGLQDAVRRILNGAEVWPSPPGLMT